MFRKGMSVYVFYLFVSNTLKILLFIEELMHIHPCKATKVNARFACIWFH